MLCQVKHALLPSALVACATARSVRDGENFSDSSILALLLLADCVRLAGQFPPPQNLYSHQQGTFLDLVLDDVDWEAKAQALRQPHPVPAGYLTGLQVPRPALCRFGVQWHEVGAAQHRQLRHLYADQQKVIYAPEVASYAYYATCVVSGSLSWGDHLRMVTFCQEVGTVVATRCAFCDREPSIPSIVVCCAIHTDGF